MSSPTAIQDVPVQRTIFDLDSMTEVTVSKKVSHTPVTSYEEGLARVGNDTKAMLEIINEGLKAEARRVAGSQPGGWMLEDEDGNETAFTGTQANLKAVNALVLTLAKTVFGYNKDLTAEQKTVAKTSAMDMVKNTESIRTGLKKSAALEAPSA